MLFTQAQKSTVLYLYEDKGSKAVAETWWELLKMDCLAWTREGTGGSLAMHINTWQEGPNKMVLASSRCCLVTGQGGKRHKLKQKVSFTYKKHFFYCESGQTLAQVAHRGCGVSILGDTQNPNGEGPEQPVGLRDRSQTTCPKQGAGLHYHHRPLPVSNNSMMRNKTWH